MKLKKQWKWEMWHIHALVAITVVLTLFVCMFVYRIIKEQENKRINEESVHKHIEMSDGRYLQGASALAMKVFDNLSKEEFK